LSEIKDNISHNDFSPLVDRFVTYTRKNTQQPPKLDISLTATKDSACQTETDTLQNKFHDNESQTKETYRTKDNCNQTEDFRQHIIQCKGVVIKCEDCNKTFKKRVYLQVHKKKFHTEN
jgi:hypothetical protein